VNVSRYRSNWHNVWLCFFLCYRSRSFATCVTSLAPKSHDRNLKRWPLKLVNHFESSIVKIIFHFNLYMFLFLTESCSRCRFKWQWRDCSARTCEAVF